MKQGGLDYGRELMRLRVDVLCPLLGIVFGLAVAYSGQEPTPTRGGNTVQRVTAASALR